MRLRVLLILSLSFLIRVRSAGAQTRSTNPLANAAAEYVAAHRSELTSGFERLLSIPNVAADPAGLRANAQYLLAALKARGASAQLLSIPGAPSVVYGEIHRPGATHTIVFYAHYDGQPVTPSEWTTPPFQPTLKRVDGEERVYARSAGDDKAAIFAQLTALDALRATGMEPKANLRFVWEGEEEAGSPHLEQILMEHREQVHGDLWLICDGPVDQSGEQTVVFGARGDTGLEITVYGPQHGLHSGHYGNWAPNPAMMLAQLLAGMEDADGHVLIPHFYDGIAPLSALEKQALAEAPDNEAMLRRKFWLGRTDGGGKHLLNLLNLPSLNINGMAAAQVGARATNVIPAMAVADLDLRLVVGEDWRTQQQRVVDYITSQGYFVTDHEPTQAERTEHARVAWVARNENSYNAVRTPMNLPMAQEVIAAVKAARGQVVLLPTMGGSVPLGAMERAAATRTITVPIANFDDNQHTANENLRLQNLWNGVGTMAALEMMP